MFLRTFQLQWCRFFTVVLQRSTVWLSSVPSLVGFAPACLSSVPSLVGFAPPHEDGQHSNDRRRRPAAQSTAAAAQSSASNADLVAGAAGAFAARAFAGRSEPFADRSEPFADRSVFSIADSLAEHLTAERHPAGRELHG